MVKLERDLSKQICELLEVYKLTGECEWWIRLNSGHVKTYYGSYIKLAAKGTPDFLALMRNRENSITALFIEAKSNKGKLRKEQVEFNNKYNHKSNLSVITITEIYHLKEWIDKYAKNFVSFLPTTL